MWLMIFEAKQINKIRRNNFTAREALKKIRTDVFQSLNWKKLSSSDVSKRKKQVKSDLFARQNAVSNVRVRSLLMTEIRVVSVA